MYRLASLIFVASASAYITRDSECPKFSSVENFNFESFSEGAWYEIARYFGDFVKDGKCGTLQYKQDGDVKKFKYTFVNNNKLMTIEGTAKLADDTGTTGKLIHTLPYGVNGTVADGELNILTVDYDNFSISYHCYFDEVKKSYQESAWIFSRSKTVSEETKAIVDKFVKDSKFLNADKFVWPSVSDEDCRVNP
ncbi:bilin-binding protein-like isoform X3 [Nymphalis io]|uniref:bilin-binding protein-like isoform X3 n=1 Tax=Inachis io TaxID=171585 RepID=UPI002167FC62|nr:bilin-binding protein-like isoform X3 [Nymphalis io]